MTSLYSLSYNDLNIKITLAHALHHLNIITKTYSNTQVREPVQGDDAKNFSKGLFFANVPFRKYTEKYHLLVSLDAVGNTTTSQSDYSMPSV
mmetsp:Transcript_13083/g.17238  ORF Transcript_13083/g.17238 Transcript_13083/m.17238 type:complete len:92 (+) Transcript_13083:120-395(+)